MNGDDFQHLSCVIEAAILAAGRPLSLDQLQNLFEEGHKPTRSTLGQAIGLLQNLCEGRGVELVKVANGYRYQTRQEYAGWVCRLLEDRPQKYSRAMLETLALIIYRQPVTRGEIEDVRGVAVSSQIVKTLLEREWIKVVGHREVPGRPALFATTRQFLDYFGLSSLDELPPLSQIRDLDEVMREAGLDEKVETILSDKLLSENLSE